MKEEKWRRALENRAWGTRAGSGGGSELEDLHAMVEHVSDIEAELGVEPDAAGMIEVAGGPTKAAKAVEEAPVVREDIDGIEGEIADVDVLLRIDG